MSIKNNERERAYEAYTAGEALALAIKRFTDLFYLVDTRDSFMKGLIDKLSTIKEQMDRDREKRRKGD